jgi:hypothetical protein
MLLLTEASVFVKYNVLTKHCKYLSDELIWLYDNHINDTFSYRSMINKIYYIIL